MKIRSLDINQFGRFENQKIVLPDSSFVIIYGGNEAGKSTLMNFMLNTLFGYPQKNSLARWLRNNEENRLGGALTFQGEDGHEFRLERMYKEKEDPRLFTGSSGIGDVNAQFHGVDRLLYQSVFCFDLEGLRGIEKMKPSDLNDFLLGAGMIGSRELAEAEQELGKRCGALFKKGGRNPEINHLLNELDRLRTEMRNHEKKLDAFRQIQEKIDRENARIRRLDQERKDALQRHQEWTAFSAIRPIIISYRALEDEIKGMGEVAHFPENGRIQYNDWHRQIAAAKDEAAGLADRIQQLNESIKSVHVDDSWISEEGNLTALFREAVKDEQNLRETVLLEDDRRKDQTEYAGVLKNLGPGWDAEALSRASVDVAFKHQLQEKTERLKVLAEAKSDASRDLAGRKEEVSQLKNRLEALEKEHGEENGGKRAHERKGRTGVNPGPLSVPMIVPALAVTALVAVISYFLLTPAAAVLIFLFGLLLSGLFVYTSRLASKNGIPSSTRNETGPAVDSRYEAELSFIREQFAKAERACEQALLNVEALKKDLGEENRQFKEWLATKGYRMERPEWAADIVRLVDEAQALLNRIKVVEARIRDRRGEHERFERERERLSDILHVPGGDAAFLEKRYNTEKERQRQVQDLKKQRDTNLKQVQILKKKLDRFYKEQDRLLELAGAADEEQFFESADRYDRLQKLKEKRNDRQMHMRELAGNEENLNRYFHDLNEGKWDGITGEELKKRLSDLEEELKAVREHLIQEKAESRSMVDNDSYRDTLDRYHALLTEVNSKAREWAVCRMAEWAIGKTKDNYRKQRLPRVLKEAERYFEQVTGGAYISLNLNDENGFAVERRDGRTFLAGELSRGTAEQLYLSLRLALTEVFDSGESLPVIIDEGFVNFDRPRAERVYSLLEKISNRRQVILFTCHDSAFLQGHPSAVLSLSGQNRQAVR